MKKLPKYFPLSGGETNPGDFQWMKLRAPKAIRYHKFKQKTNEHEFYYSEMQLYVPFRDEKSEFFPNNMKKCKEKYNRCKGDIQFAKSVIMQFMKSVQEGRERAEEIIGHDVGNELDPTKEQDDYECAMEGVHVHPELFIKEPTLVFNSSRCQAYGR